MKITKTSNRFTAMLCALVILTTGAATTGCAAVAQWWQGIVSNPVSAITLINYVLSFLQGIASIWGMIAPLIPASSQAQANTDYNNAVLTVEQSAAALEDAIRAAAAAQQSNPDLSTFIANVQAAVAALLKIVQTWQGSGGSDAGANASQVSPRAASLTEITRQAGVIANWK
jgi:hypothetical protein